ncbi:acetyl-CoA synthetase-like protein [Ramaria rubella]|nr:acetyl-CoA synthetase-like protein [Ramaria rubella]
MLTLRPGTPIKDIQSMTGITINTVPCRVALNLHLTVIETLRHIQLDQIEMGLFKTLLNFRNLPHGQSKAVVKVSSANAGTLFIKYCEVAMTGALSSDMLKLRLDFPLALHGRTSTNDLFLSMVFVTDIISEAEVNVILDYFETALLSLIHHQDAKIDVELTSAAKEHRLHFGRNPPEPLHRHLIAKTPQRIVLQFEHEVVLTYGGIDSLLNTLAFSLIDGGSYVPLDPKHPPERVQTIVGLSQAAMVLTTRDLKMQLDMALIDTGVHTACVDFRESSLAAKPAVGPIDRDIPRVLFTSGSTGTPKGVVLMHRSTTESALGSQEMLEMLDGRVMQFSNLTICSNAVSGTGLFLAPAAYHVLCPEEAAGFNGLEFITRSLDITYIRVSPIVAVLLTPEFKGIHQHLGGELLSMPMVQNMLLNLVVVPSL